MRVAALDIVLSDTFTQRRCRSACAFAQSNLNLHWGTLDNEEYKVFFYNGDSDQTARMRRLVWVFNGRIHQKVRFSLVGSYNGTTGEKGHVVES